MQLRDTSLRCASEPQHTACALRASSSRAGVNVVPSHAFANVVLRNAPFAQGDLHHARGEVDAGHGVGIEALLLQGQQGFVAQGIAPHGAHYAGIHAGLASVKSKVGGCAAYFTAFGQHVPECFAHTYYKRFVHGRCIFQCAHIRFNDLTST